MIPKMMQITAIVIIAPGKAGFLDDPNGVVVVLLPSMVKLPFDNRLVHRFDSSLTSCSDENNDMSVGWPVASKCGLDQTPFFSE